MRVLSEGGAKHLAQPQVAKEAGIPQGHLTYYFPRKVDLVRGVAERLREMIFQEVAPLLAGGIVAGIKEKFFGIAARIAQNRGRTRVLLALLVEMENDVELRNGLADRVTTLKSAFAAVLQRDLSDPDVDLAVAAAWGLGLQALVFEGRRTDEETQALFARSRARLDGQAKLLGTLSYQNVLARGFALVRAADGTMLRRAVAVDPGAALDVEFADGHIGAHADAGERKAEPRAKAPSRGRDEKQGSLL
ncbi:MAG: TetR family transcriptional regulator [Methyloceanibacter sp.]|nr:TetR family transcriptional regulator [Methyloceanibacter sp.]